MNKSEGLRKPAGASIDRGDETIRIEKIHTAENGQEQVRFSVSGKGKISPRPFQLTEAELISLLQAAIHEGVLSSDFVGNLHSFLEI